MIMTEPKCIILERVKERVKERDITKVTTTECRINSRYASSLVCVAQGIINGV